ncbi:LGFP repeat-containing protein [Microbacterium thalli]|uniref:LGFP repeat-containing protein n=1 Tax=Microbacterium thalli TaxID=3027921 RepID=A0ABT5SH59_9MICO|nr:hypothetical protein [Microbacterium thalli]MDD7962152.1 hypothetical protein [Microbacterium thalli]
MRVRRPALRRALAIVLTAVAVTAGISVTGLTAAAGTAAAQVTEQAPAAVQPMADLSTFDPGHIISDEIFFDSGSMTSAEVQRFLESRVSTCERGYTCLKDWRDTSRTIPGDAMCGPYQGAQQELASTIITKVAQACGISPKVIIVTLQKEQGLVTHTSPSTSRYTIAMGQGCPDTAACDTRYYGFFNQVYGAAWQFKRYANPPGTSNFFNWYAPGKTWNVRFHPNASCGSSPLYIRNQATANLYYYTPYQPNRAALAAGYGTGDGCSAYGNRNFFNYFTDWFGSTRAFEVSGGIGDAYVRAGGASGYLGRATSAERCGLPQDGCFQLFEGGQIHWTNATGGRATHGGILNAWASSGYERGTLGYPTSDETCGLPKSGCVQLFQGGQIHWSPATGAYATSGAILQRWAAGNYERGSLGYPTSSQTCGLVASGCFQYFEGGQIHWSPGTGAYVTSGAFREAWGVAGWERGALGYPTSEASCDSAGVCEQRFQNGSLVRSGTGPVRAVAGQISTAWRSAGATSGQLGAPTSAEVCGLVRSGCFQYFAGGQIHWSPASGAHATTGAVKDAWGTLGWEGGSLGYPTDDLTCTSSTACSQQFERGVIAGPRSGPAFGIMAGMATSWRANPALGMPTSKENCGLIGGGCYQYFTGGQMHWSPATGAWPTSGAVATAWGRVSWERGSLGYPTSGLNCGLRDGGCFQHFQGGDIHVSRAGAFPTWGGIRNAWAASGWENGPLGYPTSFEECTSTSSCVQRFEKGSITWTASGGAVVRRS